MTGRWQFEPQPVAYVREYGQGRVFYTILGHDERAFRNPAFGKLIHRGIWWATRSNKSGPVRCGIVGYGPTFNMGKLHADLIRAAAGLSVTAVCDINPKRTDAAAKELPDIRTFDNHKKMASSGLVDIAINITRTMCMPRCRSICSRRASVWFPRSPSASPSSRPAG